AGPGEALIGKKARPFYRLYRPLRARAAHAHLLSERWFPRRTRRRGKRIGCISHQKITDYIIARRTAAKMMTMPGERPSITTKPQARGGEATSPRLCYERNKHYETLARTVSKGDRRAGQRLE